VGRCYPVLFLFHQLLGKGPAVCRKASCRFAEQGGSLLVCAAHLPIGAKTWDAIDEAIRLRDKLLVILSEASLGSDWGEDEVSKGLAEERSREQVVLLPIRIDNEVMSTAEPWAVKLRDQRNIGDFRQWKKPAEYQKSLDRLLRDLKTGGAG
jgi:hypothetical protein